MKKVLSIVLALCMVLSVLAVPAFAADPATTIGADAETAGYIAPTPTYVYNAEDGKVYKNGVETTELIRFSTANLTANPAAGSKFEVRDAADLKAFEAFVETAGAYTLEGSTVYQTSVVDMTGITFDGIGWEAGSRLFKGTYDGQGFAIKNMKLTKGPKNTYTLGMFGLTMANACLKNIYVDNTCSVDATGMASDRGIATICGWLHTTARVENCYSAATITNGNQRVGGIAGFVVAGPAANQRTVVTNCTFEGTITMPDEKDIAGGIVGACPSFGDTCYTSITNCVNKGTISGRHSIGGIVGHVLATSMITNCINEGEVIGTGANVGGIVGNNEGAPITNCENKADVTGDHFVGGVAGLSNGASVLQGCVNSGVVKATTTGDACLGGLVGNANAASSLTIIGCANYGAISTTGDKFTGGIVGNFQGGCSISNTVNTADVTAKQFVGGIVGQANGAGKTANITNCVNTGSITGTQDAGGIVGNVSQPVTIKNCSNLGAISSNGNAGGIVGRTYATTTTIENCANKGVIVKGSAKGGIIGLAHSLTTTFVLKNNINYQAGDFVGALQTVDTGIEGNVSKATDAWTVGYQVTKVEGEKQNLRIVASIDSVEYQNVGFNITVTDKTGAEVKKIENFNCEYVYTELTAIGELDNKIDVAKVRPNGYLYALNIQQIPVAAGELTFTVQSYAVAKDGNTVIGETITFTHTVGNV